MVKLFGRRVPLHSALPGSGGEPWFVNPFGVGCVFDDDLMVKLFDAYPEPA
jgi:hypothetical protein